MFAPLFTFSGNVTVDDILCAIHVDKSEQDTKPGDSVLLAFLKRFIQETNENGIVECVYSIWTCNHNHSFCVFLLNLDRKSFKRHVTGTTAINKKGIKVCFMEDEHGAITAQTCGNLIVFPRGIFTCTEDDYRRFKLALSCVIIPGKKSFNTV